MKTSAKTWVVEWFEEGPHGTADGEWDKKTFTDEPKAVRFFEDTCDRLIESTGERPAHCSLEEVEGEPGAGDGEEPSDTWDERYGSWEPTT